MEPQFVAAQNGVEAQTTDLNSIGLVSAVADDRALHELFRFIPNLSPGFPGKYILPAGYGGSGSGSYQSGTNQPTVVPATGSVNIFPFRAIIGSTTTLATSALENYRGARSGVFTGLSMGVNTLQWNQTFANNASGNPRWDLVYAAVNVSAAQTTVSRFVKAPTTLVPTLTSVSPGLQCTVTIGVVAGTPGATPAQPALPADAGTTWNVPLAYVRILNGFTGATVLTKNDVQDASTPLPIHAMTGASTVRPANYVSAPSGNGVTAMMNQGSGAEKWAASGNRPGEYMAASMTGEHTVYVPLRFITINSVPINTVTNIDADIDWRGRIFRWEAIANNGANNFPWDPAAAASAQAPFSGVGLVQGGTWAVGYSSSMGTADAAFAAGAYTIASLTNATMSQLTAPTGVRILVSSTGILQVSVNATNPAALIFFRVTASGPFPNV